MATPVSTDNKIDSDEYLDKGILVAELPIEPDMSGEQLQERFDMLGLLIKNRLNDLVDSLLVSFVASNITNEALTLPGEGDPTPPADATTVAGQLAYLMYEANQKGEGGGSGGVALEQGVVTDYYLSNVASELKARFAAHIAGTSYKHAVGHLPTGTTASTVALGNHTHSSYASTSHDHDASDIGTGKFGFDRLPTGTSSTTVAVGNHVHAAGSINSGKLALDRLPTGTTASTVALGSHTHAGTDIATGSIDQARIPTLAMSKISGLDAALNSKQNTIPSEAAVSSVLASALTAQRAVVTGTDGKLAVSSTVTTAHIGRLQNLRSDVQEQIDSKQATITGAATSITSSNLTNLRALVSNDSGKVVVSSVTSGELYQLNGIDTDRNIQAQLNGKAAANHTHGFQDLTGVFFQPGTPPTTNNAGKIWLKPIT